MTLGCDSFELVTMESLSRLKLVSGFRIAAVGFVFFEVPDIESVGHEVLTWADRTRKFHSQVCSQHGDWRAAPSLNWRNSF